jgi:hypothetical protein
MGYVAPRRMLNSGVCSFGAVESNNTQAAPVTPGVTKCDNDLQTLKQWAADGPVDLHNGVGVLQQTRNWVLYMAETHQLLANQNPRHNLVTDN